MALVGVVGFALGVAFQSYYDSFRGPAQPLPGELSTAKPDPPKPVIPFDREPLWAYGFETVAKSDDKAPAQAPPTRELRPNEDPAEQTRPRRARGSNASYSLVDVRDGHDVIDWFPQDHPLPMPSIIKHGPAAGTGNTARGCGSCHLPNGKGRPENAPPAGLPVAYFMRQLQDFKNDLRRSADPRKPNTNTMIELAKVMTDEEMRLSAEYFAAIKWTPWIRVIESDLVPKTRIVGNLFLPTAQERTEPIAGRIIEVPEDVEQAETLRNPRSGFIAYVPSGSIEKGRDLVTTGGMRIVGNEIIQGKTTPCVTCHGLDLMGVADVPPIAGRSPSYIVRQVWDIQQGARNGAAVQLMRQAIAGLNGEDLVSIAAYVSSRVPPRSVSRSSN
jgi:cytochrome c553